MSCPVVALLTSTIGDSAVTCTCSVTPPTDSGISSDAVWPDRTSTFSLRVGRKPVSSVVTTYWRRRRQADEQRPAVGVGHRFALCDAVGRLSDHVGAGNRGAGLVQHDDFDRAGFRDLRRDRAREHRARDDRERKCPGKPMNQSHWWASLKSLRPRPDQRPHLLFVPACPFDPREDELGVGW